MTKYMIYDENNELMRVVGRKEEADYIMRRRSGWSYKRKIERLTQGYREAEFVGEALI